MIRRAPTIATIATIFLTAACGVADAKDLTVASDGSADFKSVQSAVDAVPSNNTERVVIRIKPGTYKERILVPDNKPFITFKGESDDPKATVLTNDWNASRRGPDGQRVGTAGSYSTRIVGHDFVAENITFENTAGKTGQALAMSADGDRLVFRNCRFTGWQDTLYANGGRQYYVNCYITGQVDFIFGGATAVFNRCQIHSRNGGFVTAASTPQEKPFGYVFLDCNLTGDDIPWAPPGSQPATLPADKSPPKAVLGRPWRPYAAVAYIRCDMGDHISRWGWGNWNKPENEKTARYSEYKSTGPGGDRSQRAPWSRVLSDKEAQQYTVSNILKGDDNWDPTHD